MEQSSEKIGRALLAAGLALALAAAAWQYFSPASRELMSGRDVSLALLGERSSALLVYHPFSSTVNAFTMAHPRAKPGVSGWHRAVDLAKAAGGTAAGENVFYIALSSAPDLDALWGTLNNWRAEPKRLLSAVFWVSGLRDGGATNISAFDLFSLFGEFSKLGSSNFILTEISRRAQAAEIADAEGPASAPRVEVYNASGRKGLAARAAKRLRALGFDVITEASYPTLEKHTAIIGFSSDTAAALKLRGSLGLTELKINVRSSQKSVAGAAVILGQDFKSE
ncbi:MAG: LytR C-terminal domain-containing protein [Elusimicrobiota bacterium]|nr:LytR C-terminal domain-containing protein [Elusimicrobiota bacterium]